MNYNTIRKINEFAKKFKYVSPWEDTICTWSWEDIYFGYREEDFDESEYCPSEVEYAKREWDLDAREICFESLRRKKDILFLRFNRFSKAKDGSSSSSLTDTFRFTYIQDIGFINTFTKKTLKEILLLSDKENFELNEIFENEINVKKNFNRD